MKNSNRTSKKYNIFLSHSHKNLEIANKLKEEIESRFDLNVFVAHGDIEPSEEWISTIMAELDECDIFMPLLTNEFKASKWTDQETGIAISKEKIIIPIRVNLVPYGFIGKYQALPWDNENFDTNIKRIIQTLIKKNHFTVDDLVKSFVNSRSWSDAALKADMLNSIDNISEVQINRIARAAIENNQIASSFGAKKYLLELFKRYWDSIDEELQEKVWDRYHPII